MEYFKKTWKLQIKALAISLAFTVFLLSCIAIGFHADIHTPYVIEFVIGLTGILWAAFNVGILYYALFQEVKEDK